jgi:hypothetical protein
MTKNIKDKLAGAKLPTTTVSICLRADLAAEWEDLQRELASAQAATAGMLNPDNRERRRIAEQIRALEEQMTEDTVVFHLRAVSRSTWRDLITGHPAREDDEADRILGLNSDTFWPALLRASIYDPAMDDEDWGHLLADDVLTDRQYSLLCDAAWALNRRDVSVPFSPAASAILGSSASASRRPSGSASAPDDSTAGSQSSTPSTNTTTPDA